MNARQAAIAHYGGRCAWCGGTDCLELDHLAQGTGNTHRRVMGVSSAEAWSIA